MKADGAEALRKTYKCLHTIISGPPRYPHEKRMLLIIFRVQLCGG